MHFLGMDGMQRRVPDYPEAFAGWHGWATTGYIIMAVGMVFFFVNIFWSLLAGKKAPDNPWGEGATTLEWTLSSPAAFPPVRDASAGRLNITVIPAEAGISAGKAAALLPRPG
jgi:heme/copper-type cytochrome/quinol oxidase subunit 1